MFIRDHYNIVNTGERLYSVILDEDELRMFNEISSREQEKSSDKKKNITKGAIIASSGLGGAAAGYLGGDYLGKKIAINLSKKDILEKGKDINGVHYSANMFKEMAKNNPSLLKQIAKDDAMKSIKYNKKIKAGSKNLAIAGGLAAMGYSSYKLLKKKKDKKR